MNKSNSPEYGLHDINELTITLTLEDDEEFELAADAFDSLTDD